MVFYKYLNTEKRDNWFKFKYIPKHGVSNLQKHGQIPKKYRKVIKVS